MRRLAGAGELLDGPLDDRLALRENLLDLRRINRLLGGVALSVRAVDDLAGRARDAVALIDVGTGSADIPLALLARAGRDGRDLSVTAVDARPEVLDAAGSIDPTIRQTDGLTLAVADGRSLPYPDGSFGVAHSSLVLHHLEPGAAVAFLREQRRVARGGVVVNDLSRSRLAWLGAIVLTRTIARSRYTRTDGPLSVRRAYTLNETIALMAAAGLRPVGVHVGFAGHRYAVAAR